MKLHQMYDPIRPVIESDGEELFLCNKRGKKRRNSSIGSSGSSSNKSSLSKKKHFFIPKEESISNNAINLLTDRKSDQKPQSGKN